MTDAQDFWDDVFHGCAWAAYIDQARAERCRPASEATRRRAFRYYEEELAKKNRLPDDWADARVIEATVHDEQ